MTRYGLDKRHKLCRRNDIEALFSGKNTGTAIAYPLRAVWLTADQRSPGDADVKIMVSIPKKRLKRAVERVRMRRLVREAYRTIRPQDSPLQLNLAFIYIADRLTAFDTVQRAMTKLLSAIHSPSNADPTSHPQAD